MTAASTLSSACCHPPNPPSRLAATPMLAGPASSKIHRPRAQPRIREGALLLLLVSRDHHCREQRQRHRSAGAFSIYGLAHGVRRGQLQDEPKKAVRAGHHPHPLLSALTASGRARRKRAVPARGGHRHSDIPQFCPGVARYARRRPHEEHQQHDCDRDVGPTRTC